MENLQIQARLSQLRKVMKEEKTDYYLIPTADFHGSEYVSDHFKTREYFSGFTGSAGTLLIWQEGAALWTDGRYFIQAAAELSGTGITLMKMRKEGVPTLEAFLKEHLQDGETLGFDGRVVSAAEGLSFEKELAGKRVRLAYEKDLAEGIWTDRPRLPAGKVWSLSRELAGESAGEKLKRVRAQMEESGADVFFLSKLDDIMWLYNIRGCDVECNPVALAYTIVTKEEARLFLQTQAPDEKVRQSLKEQGITLLSYGEVQEAIGRERGKKILIDKRFCSYQMYRLAGAGSELLCQKNPTERMKAVKNQTELAQMKKIYMRDNVALTKFIYWLKHTIGKEEITELTAAAKLEAYRRAIPEFLDLSFPTIAGYGPNAAMMHYEATPENFSVLGERGFLLVDSGGQYLGGTTDVTRTISLGELSKEERTHYTLVAAGMIQMTNARFLEGCTGRNLDILAREPLWERGLDYQCGTGHGVGYLLNVHEGPQALRWQYRREAEEAVLEEGMDVTNEPGIYIEGKYGIRIENVMVVRKEQKNEYGQFLGFDTLTWVPLDRNALDARFLSDRQREQINAYQEAVYEKLSPFLTDEEKNWLREETKSI